MAKSAQVLKAKPEAESVRTGLDAGDRKKIADDLEQVLSRTYMLVIKSHAYHWNVVGPQFYGIHKLTEEHYNDLFAATDELAERIRALGQLAPMGAREIVEEGKPSSTKNAPTAHDMIEDLVSDHEDLTRRIRKAAAIAEEHGDFVTHDLLTGRLAFHEKAVWMLRAIASE